MRAYIALMRIDLRLALRNKSVLFFNYFFPLFFFFLFAQLYNAQQGSSIIQVITMVTAIGILGNGLMGAGMRAVQEREANILRRYKVTPITPVPLLLASMTTGLFLYLPTLILTVTLSVVYYGMKVPPNLLSFFVFASIATVAFRSIGLIAASVVNSTQESMLIIQPLYFAMLFLSGATIPVSIFPDWLQIVSQFIPATFLMTGVAGILQRGESIFANWEKVLALLITGFVGVFISTKLFRWEKEEKLKPAAKLWVLVVLLPFFILGSYMAWSKEDLRKSKLLDRGISRGRTLLIQNARIVVGNGKVIESGAVLVKGGKIDTVFSGTSPDGKALKAEPIDAAGKTILPGLIDVHVHLGNSGGFLDDYTKFDYNKAGQRELEGYLYSGVTAVRSAGDQLDYGLRLRQLFNSGERLGTELFICGPLFTVEGGHGTEYAQYLPAPMRAGFNAQFLRLPKSPAEARQMVDALAAQHVDAIKGILDAGAPGRPYKRMGVNILRAVVEEAHAHNLPVSIHTGTSADVADAVAMGANSIEHGSYVDLIPDEILAAMKARGIALDPTLSVVEGFHDFADGDTKLLKRSLVQQVTSKELIAGTEHAVTSDAMAPTRASIGKYPMSLVEGDRNLLNAWRAGVTLVTGSDAGNFLVFHGPTVQRELELWVAAGIPPAVALQAATNNAAHLLGASDRIGTIEPGKEATLLVVDGNPLQDISALSSVSFVIMKGERVDRSGLFDQK
jgi:imidazolonepropionase-like amidohydrolase/ABC-type multidrug transport system permease subunit